MCNDDRLRLPWLRASRSRRRQVNLRDELAHANRGSATRRGGGRSWITNVIHGPRRQPTRQRNPLPYNLHGPFTMSSDDTVRSCVIGCRRAGVQGSQVFSDSFRRSHVFLDRMRECRPEPVESSEVSDASHPQDDLDRTVSVRSKPRSGQSGKPISIGRQRHLLENDLTTLPKVSAVHLTAHVRRRTH